MDKLLSGTTAPRSPTSETPTNPESSSPRRTSVDKEDRLSQHPVQDGVATGSHAGGAASDTDIGFEMLDEPRTGLQLSE